MTPTPDDVAKIILEAAQADRPPQPGATATSELNVDLSIDLEEHKLSFQIECLEHDLKELRDTHGLRLAYTGRIFWLVVAWLACVVACIVMSGFRLSGFQLSDSVLIAFITSTTVNVVGLFVLVAKWMFPSGKDVTHGTDLHIRAESLRSNRK